MVTFVHLTATRQKHIKSKTKIKNNKKVTKY